HFRDRGLTPISEQGEVLRRHRREDARELRPVEAVDPSEKPGEKLAVFVQHRVVAILEQRSLGNARLLADDALSLDRPAQHPVHAAVAVVGAALAVLADGAAEFADDDHHRVAPGAAHALREGAQAAAELLQARGELAGLSALAYVRVPAADVDEAEVVLALHQLRDAPRLQLEAARVDRVASGGLHLAAKVAHHALAHGEAFAHRRAELAVAVHLGDERALARVDRGGPQTGAAEREVGDRLRAFGRRAAESERHVVGERDRAGGAQRRGEAPHETRLVAAPAAERLARLGPVPAPDAAARG